MVATLADRVVRAAESARRHARSFGGAAADALPWAVIEAFDTDIRGNIERDRRIEDERDRVLIAAVTLAEIPVEAAEARAAARDHLVEAVDYLEQAVLRFGIGNRRAAQLGLGPTGQRVGPA